MGRLSAFVVAALAVLSLTACGAVAPTQEGANPAAAPEPAPQALSVEAMEAAAARIDGFVDTEMRRTGVPGLAVAVVHQDRVVFSRGYGLRQVGQEAPVDADTVFQLASLSKPIGATGVAALVGEGLFEWDDPVHPYAPALRFSEDYVTEHVTFADLYSHRTGLPGQIGDGLETIGYNRRQILQRLRLIDLEPFRATYAYTNFGLTAGGDAAARAAGTTYAALLEERLFEPAGMTSSSARYDDFIGRSNRAQIHARIGGEWVPGPVRDADPQAPAGGVSSSVNDLARWVRLQLAGGMLDGQPIVEADALAATHTPHILRGPLSSPEVPGSFYGLGWNVSVDHLGATRWSHSGAFSNGAATTAVLLPAQQLGVVVLTNGMPIGVPEILADQIVDTAVTGEPTRDWVEHWGGLFSQLFVEDPSLATPPDPATPPQPLSAYVGRYRNAYWGTFRVRLNSSGGLEIIQGPARLVYPLTHFDADRFTYRPAPELPDLRVALRFIADSDGRVTGLDVGDPAGWNVLRRLH